MYRTFEEAKKAALEVIDRVYGGDKMDCCVTENKLRKDSTKTTFSFRFLEKDSNGEFVPNGDGSWSICTRI